MPNIVEKKVKYPSSEKKCFFCVKIEIHTDQGHARWMSPSSTYEFNSQDGDRRIPPAQLREGQRSMSLSPARRTHRCLHIPRPISQTGQSPSILWNHALSPSTLGATTCPVPISPYTPASLNPLLLALFPLKPSWTLYTSQNAQHSPVTSYWVSPCVRLTPSLPLFLTSPTEGVHIQNIFWGSAQNVSTPEQFLDSPCRK